MVHVTSARLFPVAWAEKATRSSSRVLQVCVCKCRNLESIQVAKQSQGSRFGIKAADASGCLFFDATVKYPGYRNTELTSDIGTFMETQEIIGLVSRWLHIIPATILVGGTLFLRFSFVPAANESKADDGFRESIRKRWSKLVMLSILLLLVSGLYNAAMKAMGFELSMTYNVLLLAKIVFGLGIFYLLSVLSGRSKTAQKFRERELYWLNIVCALLILVVMIAGYMKMDSADFSRKVKTENESVTSLAD